MKILVYISFLFVFSIGTGALAQNQYKTHYVKKGETVFSIAKQYGVSTEAIYELNPDVTNGVKINSILIIPERSGDAVSEVVRYKTHKVKRKETLFGIAQLYNISIDDIKKYNKELYSRSIKKGEKISIPVFKKKTIPVATETTTQPASANHTVAANETKFGIARKYGISIAELETLNPTMGENLQTGTILNVPEISVISSASIDDDYDFYEVQPKEGFFRLKVKLGLSEEEIVALNPYASEGLKDGMILKIPKENLEEITIDKAAIVNLESRIINKSRKNLAVLLPFQLNKVETDSISANSELLKKGGTLRVALDFYSGVLMAAEFARDKGIWVHLDVYDTEGSESKTRAIISKNDFRDIDAVIGPLRQKNVEIAAALLRDSKTPIFSPLSNRAIQSYSNFFQSVPTDIMLRKSMLEFLKTNRTNKNMLLISDVAKNAQRAEIIEALPGTKLISPREKGFLYVGDIDSKLDKDKENWVILESDDPIIISNVLGLLNGMPQGFIVRLFTLDKNDAYDYHDVSNLHLAKLNFTFPSVNKSYNYKEKDPFLVSYKNKYGVYPNRYAVRGFDITYDILLRLASSDDLYDSSKEDYETEYVENKFHYTKNSTRGYQNTAAYIIKYMNNLEFEIVK
jgi:LysM repeat protein